MRIKHMHVAIRKIYGQQAIVIMGLRITINCEIMHTVYVCGFQEMKCDKICKNPVYR